MVMKTAKSNGDPRLEDYGNLVMSVARRHHRPGAFLEMEDLIQHGRLGLLRAMEKFNSGRISRGRPVTFVTYATYWIQHAIRRSIQDHGRTVAIPVSAQKVRPAPVQEILPLEALARYPAGRLADDSGRLVYERESRRRVRDLLGSLTDRERGVIEQLFGLIEGRSPETIVVVARRMGISPQRVGQLKTKALKKLRRLAARTPPNRHSRGLLAGIQCL